MDLTIKKFIDYLESYTENYAKNKFRQSYVKGKEHELTAGELIKELVIVKNLIHYFQTEREDIGIVFNEFPVLSTYLLQSPLSMEERLQIIFELCKRNYSLCGKSDILVYDLKKIRDFRFEKMELEDATSLWFDSIFPNCFSSNDKFLTREASKTRDALVNSPQLLMGKNQDIFDNSSIVNQYYLDKIDSYKAQDVEVIVEALKNLGINNVLCQKIRSILLKDVNQRLEQEKLVNIQNRVSSQTEIKKEVFQQVFRTKSVNYEEVYSELKDVVDLRDMRAKCSLSLDQIIYYVSLLLYIKINRADVQMFLKNVEVENNRCLHNPISLYLELYDKLKYYEERLCLFENMKLLEDYFQELFIASDEEYEFWKLNFQQEFNHYLKEIPGSFDYEFREATKRLEKKKMM